MDDAGCMQVLDAAQHLVEQVGQPLMVQLHLDHLAQVSIHELHHQVPGGGGWGMGDGDGGGQHTEFTLKMMSMPYAVLCLGHNTTTYSTYIGMDRPA